MSGAGAGGSLGERKPSAVPQWWGQRLVGGKAEAGEQRLVVMIMEQEAAPTHGRGGGGVARPGD